MLGARAPLDPFLLPHAQHATPAAQHQSSCPPICLCLRSNVTVGASFSSSFASWCSSDLVCSVQVGFGPRLCSNFVEPCTSYTLLEHTPFLATSLLHVKKSSLDSVIGTTVAWITLDRCIYSPLRNAPSPPHPQESMVQTVAWFDDAVVHTTATEGFPSVIAGEGVDAGSITVLSGV